MSDSEVGMRERKRAQTRRRLEEAAVDLVVRHGLDNVTIEAISTRADVSNRTFFNYFDNKEDAILGVGDIDVDDVAGAMHAARDEDNDLVESVVSLFIGVFGPSISDAALHHNRLTVIRHHPELLSRQMARMTRMNEQLTIAVTDLMAQAAPARRDDAAVAGVVVMTCGAAIRAAIREWAAGEADISLDALQRRAVELVRETTETLR